jgi:hypothetical protein
MPQLRPQTRFLLRASTLLIGLLVFWWWILCGPMVAALRVTVETTGGLFFGGRSLDLVHVTASGDWSFHVPMEAVTPTARIHSVDFDLAATDVNAFTFSLPVFWAIVLAAPHLRRNLGTLAFGSVAMVLVELLLMMIFIEIYARNAAFQVTHAQSAFERWALHFAEYLIVSVLPYAAPFVLALTVHRDLRVQILGWGGEPASSAPPEPNHDKRKPAKRHRSYSASH